MTLRLFMAIFAVVCFSSVMVGQIDSDALSDTTKTVNDSTAIVDSTIIADTTVHSDSLVVSDTTDVAADSVVATDTTQVVEEAIEPVESVIDTATAIVSHLDSTITALENNNIERAFLQLAEVGKYAPIHPDAEFYYGNAYLMKARQNDKKFIENTDSALTHIEKAIELDSVLYAAYYIKGLVYYTRGEKANDKYAELRPEKRLLDDYALAWDAWQELKEMNPDYDYESSYPAMIYEIARAFDLESNIGNVYTIEQYLLKAEELMKEAADFNYDAAIFWLDEHAPEIENIENNSTLQDSVIIEEEE